MNYTPLDIDQFRARFATSSNESASSSVNSDIGSPPNKSHHFPLIAIFIVAATFLVTLITVTRFAKNPNIQKTEAEQPKPARKIIKLVAGTDATFSPMEYKNENNEIIGYDIEFGKKLAEELNADIEFVNLSWDDVFKSLEENKIDMIIASVTITADRKQKYLFSDPYLNAGQVVITRKSDTSIKSPYDLSGKKIGVQKDTTNEHEATKYTSDNLVIRYSNFVEASKELLDGKVDAVFSDLPAAKGIITDNPGLMISSDPFTEEYYGVVFRKDQQALAKEINAAITSLRQKGVLNNLKEKYLN